MNNTIQPSFAIILSDSRSGSTFLSSLLNQYDGLRMSLESGFPRLLIEWPMKIFENDEDLKKVLDLLYSEIQFQEMNVNREILERFLITLKKPISKKQIFDAIARIYFENNATKELDSKCTYILKIPVAYQFLDALQTLIPGFKIIHLIRDGRAVFASKRNSISLKGEPFEKNLLVAVAGWKKKQRLAALKHPENIRYEDLVTGTETAMHSLLDYLIVDATARTKTRQAVDYANSIGEKQKTFHTNVGKVPQKSSINKWVSDLTSTEIFLYEWIAFKELKKYGYRIYEFDNASLKKYLKASFLYVYFIFHYIADRTKNFYRAILKGQHRILIRKKLIQVGILQPQ